jgi:hypothetical protein
MKYKVILKTTGKNKDRVHRCLKIWLRDIDYVCLTDNLTGEFNEISGSKRDDYYSAEEKTVFFINQVITTTDYDEYDWLAFIDDDAILNTKMFEYVMPYMDKNCLYGLKMHGSYERAPTTIYPSGGSGYFISPSLLKGKSLMVDNGWGIEDASLGRWIEQNNVCFEENVNIDGTLKHLKLNGWFPFSGERTRLNAEHESHSLLFDSKIIENIKDHLQKMKELNSSMTHHYIRGTLLMEYIHGCFKLWTPENII